MGSNQPKADSSQPPQPPAAAAADDDDSSTFGQDLDELQAQQLRLLPSSAADTSSTHDADAAHTRPGWQQRFELAHGAGAAAGGGQRGAAACLCGAHALARWGWRTWEFAVALILIKLFPSSLLLVSTYGLLDNLVRLLLGAFVGQLIDAHDRLRGAQLCYALQTLCIGGSAAAAAVLVSLDQQRPGSSGSTSSGSSGGGGLRDTSPGLYWLLTGVTMVLGASSSVGSLGAAVSVEREHAKVLCGDDSTALRKLNSVMRAIDLLSQMLAPVCCGFIMSGVSLLAAIAMLSCYSLASWLPQCLLLRAAHRRSPLLRRPKAHAAITSSSSRPHPVALLLGGSSWRAYLSQDTLLPGLALALLYLTVLSFGFLMTSALAWQGLSESTISLFRAAGALSGLAATAAFHPLQHCGVGLVAVGTLGVCWQLSMLLMAVVPVTLASLSWTGSSSDHRLLYVLMAGLVASRFGLWLFDLVVCQLQQERVPEHQLGTVGGVQASLQSLFETLSFVAGSTVHRPEHFHFLMAGSCGSVAAAAALYVTFACQHRTLPHV